MKSNQSKTQFYLSIFTLFTLTFPIPAEAMLTRSILNDATPIFNKSMRYIPVEPIISRTFSRYAKFDGEEHNKYIKRVQELRNADNEAWNKAIQLRYEYNADWAIFQEEYFPTPKVAESSDKNISHSSLDFSGGMASSQTMETNGFLKGWFTNDLITKLFKEETISPSSNSSHNNTNSDHETSNTLNGGSRTGNSSSWGFSESSNDWDSDGGGGSDD